MKKLILVVLATAWVSTAMATGSLATRSASPGSVDSGYVLRGGTPITQSSDTATITAANSVSCNAGGLHTDNSYMRRFDLDGDHGITSTFTVSSVDFGIETSTSSGGTQPVVVNLYSIPNASTLVLANLTAVSSANIAMADAAAIVFNQPIVGAVDGQTSDLVVEIFTPNGQASNDSFFLGSNTNGESAPNYLVAADCSIVEPTTTGGIGFPNMHSVIVVNGSAGPSIVYIVPTLAPFGLGILALGLGIMAYRRKR